MKKYIISKTTHALIRSAAINEFRDTSVPDERGNLIIEVGDDDVAERIEAARLPGESDDAVLERLVSLYLHWGAN